MGEVLPPLLLPRPRSIEFAGGVTDYASPSVVVDGGARLRFAGSEAYRLTLRGGKSLIEARTRLGALHARHTYEQLMVQFPLDGPALVIEDGPAFATRGVMLDVSRDRVPTMGELFRIVVLMHWLKFNHLQLYTEHTFAYAGHEEAWRGWSPITADEIRTLQQHCTAHGIELAANQNCFGHLAKWLTLPKYAHLAETHGDWVFENATESFPRHGPFSLCPVDPASGAFVEELLGQLLPCFSSPLVNIGCDETFDVGWGRSKEAVKERGRAAVYFEFVSKICAAVRRHGKRPMFWADIALSEPGSVGMIPEDMVCLAWDYEPTARFGEWCRVLRGAGRETWVCPGTSSWRSITGRTTERRGNLRAAAVEGLAGGATGFLVTDWGDSGHHQQWPVALAAIAEAADAAWNGTNEGYDARAAGVHVFGDLKSTELTEDRQTSGTWLDELGDLDAAMRLVGGRRGEGEGPTRLRNSSVLFNDLFMPIGPGGDEKLRRGTLGVPVEMWREAKERLEGLAARRPRGVSELVAAELDHTLRVARLAIERAIWRKEGAASSDGRRLAGEIRGIMEEHRGLWLTRCREGGLTDSCGYYERIAEEMER